MSFSAELVAKARQDEAGISKKLIADKASGKGASANAIAILVLAAINAIVFYRSLSGYFLADDFVHIPYLSSVYAGHPELLLQNFCSNWMQTSGTQFYRPLISITLACDYFFWKANAFGFHAANIAWQTASSIFLYLFVQRLLSHLGKGSRFTAFLAGALFAACPLHTEVVSWVIGRVDSVCTTFYLAALWLFVAARQDQSKIKLAASIFCFALSLFSKEMAITLPPTAALICLLDSNERLGNRLIGAIKATVPLWIVLSIYLVVRTLSLGTLTGGYSGSIGQSLTASLSSRVFACGALSKIWLPLNGEVFSPGSGAERQLKLLYTLLFSGFIARLSLGLWPSRAFTWVAFAGCWFVLSMLPTYQVFSLSDSLFGSRFIYLGTAPLCLLLALLSCPLGTPAPQPVLTNAELERQRNSLPHKCKPALFVCSMAVAVGLVICFGGIAAKNNLPWVEAGKQVRALRQSIETILGSLPAAEKIAVLNVPQRLKGAHMIYNAAMLTVALSPPLSSKVLHDRVITFEPVNYGEPDLIIVSRLRNLVRQGNCRFYQWDLDKRALRQLVFKASTEQKTLPANIWPAGWNLKGPASLLSPVMQMASLIPDFLDVEVSATGRGGKPAVLIVSWAGQGELYPRQVERRFALPLTADGSMHTCRINVSEHKSWLASVDINRLRLDFSPGYEYQVRRVQLSSGKNVIPQLSIDESFMTESNSGVSYLSGSRAAFFYNAEALPGVAAVALEITHPNAWFEHYSGTYRMKELSAQALCRWRAKAPKGHMVLSCKAFPVAGYYQARITALDNNGAVIGYCSDPINLQISQEQIDLAKNETAVFNAN